MYARLLRARPQAFGIANSYSLMSSKRDCTFLAAYDAPTVDAKPHVSNSLSVNRLTKHDFPAFDIHRMKACTASSIIHYRHFCLVNRDHRFTRDSLVLLFSSRDKPVSLLLLLR